MPVLNLADELATDGASWRAREGMSRLRSGRSGAHAPSARRCRSDSTPSIASRAGNAARMPIAAWPPTQPQNKNVSRWLRFVLALTLEAAARVGRPGRLRRLSGRPGQPAEALRRHVERGVELARHVLERDQGGQFDDRIVVDVPLAACPQRVSDSQAGA